MDSGTTALGDFTAPVFRRKSVDGADRFLYSHHQRGRVWLVGTSLVTW